MKLSSWLALGCGFFLELWSGADGLTKAMFSDGAWCLGGADVCHADVEDLAAPESVELLLSLVSRRLFKLIHTGVVCITFSKAAKPAYHSKDAQGYIRTVVDLPEPKGAKAAIGDQFAHLAVTIFCLQVDQGDFVSMENLAQACLGPCLGLVP